MSAEYNAKFANTDIATRAIHAGQEPDPTTGAVVTPIFATSTFKQDGVLGLRGGHDYSRSINPTRTSFDEQLAAVEGGKYALSFSSGLAASAPAASCTETMPPKPPCIWRAAIS